MVVRRCAEDGVVAPVTRNAATTAVELFTDRFSDAVDDDDGG
ncbi:hypothetical protein HanXRQr2_Chr07g0287821 [Helianthus annuus]|uniref:Uncharacterized protein n=1 Tax=Helianthus annuus TaxID=4232 RepID=A0A9K3IJC2_HELAN|nr:hypothetical protein HanXRQr2_Chr07g0287821 [Helianthus annuus]KAJ0914291.1 hypothetical protein HanPSC8_Chr06g0236901 [Helianthus annuus]